MALVYSKAHLLTTLPPLGIVKRLVKQRGNAKYFHGDLKKMVVRTSQRIVNLEALIM